MRTALRVLAAVLASCAPAPIVSAGDNSAALVCGDQHAWMTEAVLTREDAATLREAARLTPEQAAAAETLIDAARVKFASIRRKFHREYYTDADRRMAGEITREQGWAAYAELEKRARDAVLRVERELLDDLRTLLQPEQEDGWEGFLRARRRASLAWTPVDPRLDLCLGLRAIGVRPDSGSELAAAVEAYEREVDAAVIEYRAALAEREAAQEARSPEAGKAGERYARAHWSLFQAQCRGYRSVASKLAPASRRDLFRVRLRTGVTHSDLTENLRVSELLSLTSISPDQLASMKRALAEEQLKFLDTMEGLVGRRDDAIVRSADREGSGVDMIEDELQAVWAKSALALVERLRGALTPAQLAAYDDATDLPEHPAYGPGTSVLPSDELRVPPLPKPDP
ncbi:MAG TPA: hypothetical protein VD971_05970 [Phycisphaerales bacterium]|nr:hypothetical protein [Phycisphaerales bacterium]